MKLNFVIPGAAKGGTTALHTYLMEHPQICMTNPKESSFFDKHFDKGWDWYWNFFRPDDKTKLLGESAPGYLTDQRSYKRLKEHNPDLKLVFILRDPCDRAYSLYMMHQDLPHQFYRRYKGEEIVLPSFEEMIKTDSRYVDEGLYAKHIKEMMKFFPKEQMYFIRNEHLLYKTQDTMDKLYKWLGVKKNKLEQIGNLIIPIGGLVREVVRSQYIFKDRELIIENFLEDLSELETITGWDLTAWKRYE